MRVFALEAKPVKRYMFSGVWQRGSPQLPRFAHPVAELRGITASAASTTAVLVSFTPASVVASPSSASVFTAKTVTVVSTAAASSRTASPASARSTLHYCQLWPDTLARGTG